MGTKTMVHEERRHICEAEYVGVGDMLHFYHRVGIIPTSTNGDTLLIRSHIAYWSGGVEAARVSIRPSRGHSYRVTGSPDGERIVRISNEYDHREGVQGWV